MKTGNNQMGTGLPITTYSASDRDPLLDATQNGGDEERHF
jgi:hypothetical protein